MALTIRTRILIGVAAAVLAYVVLGQKDPTTVEPVGPSGAATLVTRSATPAVQTPHKRQTSRPASGHLLELLAHRVADSGAYDALFPVHAWYVAPPPPPPPAPAPAAGTPHTPGRSGAAGRAPRRPGRPRCTPSARR